MEIFIVKISYLCIKYCRANRACISNLELPSKNFFKTGFLNLSWSSFSLHWVVGPPMPSMTDSMTTVVNTLMKDGVVSLAEQCFSIQSNRVSLLFLELWLYYYLLLF